MPTHLYPLDEFKVKVSSELTVGAAAADWQAWGVKQLCRWQALHITSVSIILPENT